MANIRGLEEVLANLNRISDELKDELGDSLTTAGLDLKGKAQNRAPIDTGDLRGSAVVEVNVNSTEISAEVGFGTKYALKQHEDLSLNHPQGGEAKYLENPLKENARRYFRWVTESVRRVLR